MIDFMYAVARWVRLFLFGSSMSLVAQYLFDASPLPLRSVAAMQVVHFGASLSVRSLARLGSSLSFFAGSYLAASQPRIHFQCSRTAAVRYIAMFPRLCVTICRLVDVLWFAAGILCDDVKHHFQCTLL